MTKEQLKLGKLYRNRNNKYMYDTILCVTDMKIDSSRVFDSYVEYHWIKLPHKTYYTTLVTAITDWEPLDE